LFDFLNARRPMQFLPWFHICTDFFWLSRPRVPTPTPETAGWTTRHTPQLKQHVTTGGRFCVGAVCMSVWMQESWLWLQSCRPTCVFERRNHANKFRTDIFNLDIDDLGRMLQKNCKRGNWFDACIAIFEGGRTKKLHWKCSPGSYALFLNEVSQHSFGFVF